MQGCRLKASWPANRSLILVRLLVAAAAGQGVAFFFKQWGGFQKKKAGRVLDGRTWDEMPRVEPVNPRRSRVDR